MEKPFRYRKKLVRVGSGDYVLLPATWIKQNLKPNEKDVVVEVYKNHVKVIPAK